MQQRYRIDYEGEFVITESRWVGGRKEQTREWVPNPIVNQHISGRAACIGSVVDRWQFDHTVLRRHRGGLLSSKKLQTYGIGDITKEMNLDFAVEIDRKQLIEIKESGYSEKNIVYTTARMCVENPGEFYLIPYNPILCNLAMPLYLAAFDNHREIFLIGYNNDTPSGTSNWQLQVAQVIMAYPGTQFTVVGIRSNIPDQWFDLPNVNNLSYREFISYCDV